jgi:exopolysaccharide production protein ExoZ
LNTEKDNREQIVRLNSLDYLRGSAALGVMVFHYSKWTFGDGPASGVLSRLGLYSVSIFYVLSGLTLYMVYVNRLAFGAHGVRSFLVKRLFRIFPLLWLTLVLNLLLLNQEFGLTRIILNATGLFGLVDWAGYIGTGVWSIGNELAFYLAFILVWYASQKKMFLFCLGLSAACFAYFAYFVIEPHVELTVQWHNYVNPLNQVFFFIAGMAIGKYFRPAPGTTLLRTLVVGALVLLIAAWPNLTSNLVSGTDRLVLGLSTVGLCMAIYALPKLNTRILHRTFAWFGEVSYSVYLLHPIVYGFVFGHLPLDQFGVKVRLPLAILLTFLLSFMSYTLYEKRFIRLGGKLNHYLTLKKG